MDKVNIDTVGPFEEDEDGNKYIMAFIDVFSRFIELIAVRDLTALTAAKELVKFFGCYGNPSEVLTDNGTQYQNELANYIYDRMMVNHISIMPYSHEENGIVERGIKEVNIHLRAIVFDRKIKENWSMALPLEHTTIDQVGILRLKRFTVITSLLQAKDSIKFDRHEEPTPRRKDSQLTKLC